MSNIILNNGDGVTVLDSSNTKAVPIDGEGRGIVDNYSDIKNIRNPYLYMKVIVRNDSQDDTHLKGEYVITKLTNVGRVDETGIMTLNEYIGETDPKVYEWAKQPTKPSYTASEVGAVPSTRTVNGKSLNSDISLTPSDIGAQTTIDPNHKVSADNIDDTNTSHKFVTSNEKTAWNNKVDKVSEATNNNFAALDSNGNLKDSTKKASDFASASQGVKADSAIQGIQIDNTDLTKDSNNKVNISTMTGATASTAGTGGLIPAPSAGDNEKILQGDGNWVPKPSDGLSAYEIWLDENDYLATDYTKKEFLASLKAQFGSFVPAEYGTDGEPNDGSTNIPASADTTNHIYLVDDDPDTPTAKVMWITVVDETNPQSPVYTWTSIGTVNVNLKFDSGESINNIKIDNTQLVNPAVNSLAKAGDVMTIKQELGGIEVEETLASYEPTAGYINGATGQKYPVSGTSNRCTYINVTGYKKVRFKGLLLRSGFADSVPVGFAFGTMSGTIFTPIRYLSYEKSDNTNSKVKEYIIDIPVNCTHFAVTTKYESILDNFYCYLQKGTTVKESIKGIHKEYAVYSKSNGSVTREVIWNIDLLKDHTYRFFAKGISVSGTSSFYIYKSDGTSLIQLNSITTSRNEVEYITGRTASLLGCTIHASVNTGDTVIYGVEDITNQKIVERAALINGLDDEPTPNSSKLVKSGGVYSSIPLSFLKTGTVTSTAEGNAFSLKNINLQAGKRYKITVAISSSSCNAKIVKSTDISDIIETLSNAVSSASSPATLYYIPSNDLKDVAIAHYINASGATVEVSIEELSEVKLREDIAALNTRVTAIENSSTDISGDVLGIVKKEMTVVAGEHSSLKESDKLIFPIRKYAYHKIALKNVSATITQASTPNNSIAIYAYYPDAQSNSGYSKTLIGRSASINAGESMTVEWRPLRDDYEFIGAYFVVSAGGAGKLELSCDTNYSDVIYGKEKYDSTHDIISMNTEAIRRVSSINTKFRHYGDASETERYLCLLMMTDTHLISASGTAMTTMKRAFTLGEHSLFNAIIHGGDLVETTDVIAYIKTAYKNLVLDATKPVLALAGNHDCGGSTTDAIIQDLLFNEDLVGHNGETHPTINNETKNYYYKDITVSGNIYRIIGLYSYEWGTSGRDKARVFYTQDQIDWLLNLLNNTPSSTPVAILSHTAISPVKFIDSPFNDPNKRNLYDDTIMDSYMDGNTFFYKIIDAWVKGNEINETATQTVNGTSYNIVANKQFSGTHTFIGNICGHKHSGGVGYLAADDHSASPYRIIIQPTTNPTYTQNTGWWRRSAGDWNEDCLNAIVYGKYTKGSATYDKLSIIRFGQYINLFGEDCKAFTF